MQPIARLPQAAGILALAAMLLGAGACELPALRGRVVDRDTHAPIAGARVVELWRAGRALSDVAATRSWRVATTDAEGRFELPRETSARALRAGRAPSYVLIEPRYGLVRAGEREPVAGALDFEMSRDDVTARQSFAALCESRPREDWEREVAAAFCSRR